MRKRVQILVLIGLFCITLGGVCQKSKPELVFDDSGTQAFIKLCEAQRPIDISAIDSLLELEAYQRMIKWTERNWGGLDTKDWQNIFAAALIPERYSLRQDLELFYIERAVEHIKWAKENTDKIEMRLKEIREKWNPAQIIAQAKKYLPKEIPEAHFRVSYVIGPGQGCAYDSEIIIDERAESINRPIEMLMRVLSHEIHHCYHMLLPTEDYVDNGKYQGILQALYWLEMEGIASMVQYEGINLDSVIQSLIKQHGEQAEIWFSAYEDANIHLQSLDNAMKDIFEGRAENPYQHAISALRPADFGGWSVKHQVGHVMAMRIEEELGRDALIKCVGKPCKFLITYQESAKKIGDPNRAYIFSDYTISNLDRLFLQSGE